MSTAPKPLPLSPKEIEDARSVIHGFGFPAYSGLDEEGDSATPYHEGRNEAIDACFEATVRIVRALKAERIPLEADAELIARLRDAAQITRIPSACDTINHGATRLEALSSAVKRVKELCDNCGRRLGSGRHGYECDKCPDDWDGFCEDCWTEHPHIRGDHEHIRAALARVLAVLEERYEIAKRDECGMSGDDYFAIRAELGDE